MRCQACDKRAQSAWISVGPNATYVGGVEIRLLRPIVPKCHADRNSDDDQFSAGDQFGGLSRLRGGGFRFGRPDTAGG